MQTHGRLDACSSLVVPPDASGPLKVMLHLETHFGSVKVPLTKHQPEQDATALKQLIESGEVEHQLHRGVMWAVACLVSPEPKTRQAGMQVLGTIDGLERYAKALSIPDALDRLQTCLRDHVL